MTRKDVNGDQPSGGETTWTNTGATRYGRGQHKTGSFGDDMLRPSPNHGTQRLPNDDDDDVQPVHMYVLLICMYFMCTCILFYYAYYRPYIGVCMYVFVCILYDIYKLFFSMEQCIGVKIIFC